MNPDLHQGSSKLFMPDVHLICNRHHGYKEMTKQPAIPAKYGGYLNVQDTKKHAPDVICST